MRFKRTKAKISFQSEADLEDFVWIYLEQLFGFKALKRQHGISGECCDILATTSSGGLAILELKNQLDRYVVQQLTRYYEYVITEKPFSLEINYEIPVQLVAISPGFHRHNLIDQKYSRLQIDFLTFQIHEREDGNYFELSTLDAISKALICLPESENQSIKDVDPRAVRQDQVNTILYHYVRVRHAHKLGLPDVSPEELAASKAKFPNQGSKLFKIRINDSSNSKGEKFVSVRVPSSIQKIEFQRWVRSNIPTATGTKSSAGRVDNRGYQGRTNWKASTE